MHYDLNDERSNNLLHTLERRMFLSEQEATRTGSWLSSKPNTHNFDPSYITEVEITRWHAFQAQQSRAQHFVYRIENLRNRVATNLSKRLDPYKNGQRSATYRTRILWTRWDERSFPFFRRDSDNQRELHHYGPFRSPPEHLWLPARNWVVRNAYAKAEGWLNTRRQYRETGRAVAKQLSIPCALLRHDKNSFVALEHLWQMIHEGNPMHRITDIIYGKAPQIAEAKNNFDRKGYTYLDIHILTHSQQLSKPLPDHLVTLLASHQLHKSDDPSDPTKIAYAPSFAYFAKDRFIRTSLGKYLTKFLGDYLTEEQIRTVANTYNARNKPLTLHLVPPTDPNGWEWVYEHGTSFTSCMTYDRNERYLIEEACGLNHPVRAYAHPSSNLHLAYIGVPGTEVWARTIVNPTNKTYVRVYGDDRMYNLLQTQGYTEHRRDCCINQPVSLMPRNNPDDPHALFLPYLDWGQVTFLDDKRDKLVFIDSSIHVGVGGGSNGTASTRFLRTLEDQLATPKPSEDDEDEDEDEDEDDDENIYCCDDCGDDVDEDDTTYIESHDHRVCSSCLDNNYQEAIVNRRGGTGWIHEDDAVYCESNGNYYTDSVTDYHGVRHCESRDSYYLEDDMVYVSGRSEWVHQDDAVRLDHPTTAGGDDYIHEDDVTTTADDLSIHDDDAETCEVTHKRYFAPSMWEIEWKDETTVTHPHAIARRPELFSILRIEGEFYIVERGQSIECPQLLPFFEALVHYGYPTEFANVTLRDDCEGESVDDFIAPFVLALSLAA